MKRVRKDTRLEIWGTNYINFPERRNERDKNAKVIQIEPGNNGDYIVEVYDTCRKE